MKYRAEIDGLRALAVVPVILFHAGFDAFSGGFVGVDVFFVISGYLITTILIEDIERDRFSLLHFYERRARRILPALFLVMLVCIPFAWMWMLPAQLKDFSQSLVAVSFFASNILFWRESNYFAAAAEEKPLLHTWSLAVEEQYYLLFPVFLFLAWRFGKNRVFWMIVVCAALSLAFTEWGWRNDPRANFYLAPTRAWELFAGSIAAFVVQKHDVRPSNALSMLGLAAIVFATFAYDEHTPFPSLYTLVPVGGVVLLILFAGRESLATRLLSMKVFVGIGLISYSAYLWHQPLFAFARLTSADLFVAGIFPLLIVATFLLAVLSWKFVEQPFRNRTRFARKTVFGFSLTGILAFSALGVSGHVQFLKGNQSDLQTMASTTRFENGCDIAATGIGTACRKIGDLQALPSHLVIGDSHADAMKTMLAEALHERRESALFFSIEGCTPIRNVSISVSFIFDRCIAMNDFIYGELLPGSGFRNVIVISRWTAHWLDATPFDNQEGGVETVERGLSNVALTGILEGLKTTDKDVLARFYATSLREISEKSNLILVYPVPEAGWNVPRRLHSFRVFGMEIENHTLSTSHDLFLERHADIRKLFDAFDFVDHRIRSDELFCDSIVKGRCVTQIDGKPLYYDDDHLSDFGAAFVVEEIVNALE